ncbi:MAG TPA: methyltransferase domain-containing protein [Gammaproteobacteria bacterium]|nr:methyltransferase domain-containing protein [Gammaproteobacteria bacterium]
MKVLPPGTILQLMYLRERLQHRKPGRFIEIGPGSGEITRLLLDQGWSGWSYDLEEKTIDSLQARFAHEIAEKRFVPLNRDYLSSIPPEKVDLVISCMVMEHLEDEAQISFMQKSADCLTEGGGMIGLVPASPGHWGIEDDIAGHYRRYTRGAIEGLAAAEGWNLLHVAGLTFPISNLLLPISNFLVDRSERTKLSLSALERTKHSGRRRVKFKTHFPSLFGLFLNEYTLLPLHLVQKIFKKSERALVLYFELQPKIPSVNSRIDYP